MKYPPADHEKLLPFCKNAPQPPHPDGWLTGITQIAAQLGRSSRYTWIQIIFREIYAIEVAGVLYSNLAWLPNTVFIPDPSNPDGPGIPVPRQKNLRKGRPPRRQTALQMA